MKKSFMTRALATGLSFAMAFSMAAVASTTTAFAASKPAMITYDGTSAKTLDVKLGETVKIKVNAATKSKYKVSAVKVSSSKLVAKKNTAGTVVAITGKKATEAGKPASVKVSFQVKKTKKASKYSYISKVNVLEEKTTMTAAATAVKEITLTFSKAVKDTAAAKIVVKKGNATPTFTNAKWSEDAKSVVLPMDSKLTQGTYDVTVSGVETEDLTASVPVENQKLDHFELLSTKLVAGSISSVTCGTIKFKGVDQYGKTMKATDVTVTTSFGKSYTNKAHTDEFTGKSASGDPTTVYVKLNDAMKIIGQKGSITIVGGNGVVLTSDIELVAPAQAAKVENLGLYKAGKPAGMTAGDKASDYVIALKFTDQYGAEMAASEVANVTTAIAPGTTAVECDKENTSAIKIDDKDVYAVHLKGTAAAGTFQVTLVNTQYGLLDNLSFTVEPGTVIKSFTVSADKEIYNDADTELSFTAIDANGNEVTKYDDLKKAFVDNKNASTLPKGVALNKQADGTAKLVLQKNTVAKNQFTKSDNYKESFSTALTFYLYQNTMNSIVYTLPIKVNEDRVFWQVTGINSTKVTATTEKNALEFAIGDLKIVDQYDNTLSSDLAKNLAKEKGDNANYTIDVACDSDKWVADKTKLFGDATVKVAPKAVSGAATCGVTFKSCIGASEDDGHKVTVSQVDSYEATGFAIEWKDGKNTFSVSPKAINLKPGEDFTVTGTVSGKKVTIPTDQYVILSGGSQNANTDGTKDRITKTATLTVAVDDKDHNSNIITADYTYSNEDPKLTKLSAKSDAKITVTAGDKITIEKIVKNAFELKDQYGAILGYTPSDVKANISVTGTNNKGVVYYNNTNQAYVIVSKNADDSESQITVTLTAGDLTATKTITVIFDAAK